MPILDEVFDEYGRKARAFPALLCLPPYLLVGHFIIWPLVDPSIRSPLAVTFGDVTYSLALLYLLIQVNRLVSKGIFQDRNRFPTTEALMPDGWLSSEYRSGIAERVRKDFTVELPGTGELTNRGDCLRRCDEIASLIVGKVGKGRLLLQHNIEYGFWRNLLGGAVLAAIVSALGAAACRWWQPNSKAFIVALLLLAAYAMLLLFARFILRRVAQEYARILFREYMGEGRTSGGNAA